MAKERYFITIVYRLEPGLYRLVVRDAFRVHAAGDTFNLFRHRKFLLLHDPEIPYDIDCGLWGYDGQLVELVIPEELILYLDDALFPEVFAVKVDADGYPVLLSHQSEYLEDLEYVPCRDVVKYGAVLQCADH